MLVRPIPNTRTHTYAQLQPLTINTTTPTTAAVQQGLASAFLHRDPQHAPRHSLRHARTTQLINQHETPYSKCYLNAAKIISAPSNTVPPTGTSITPLDRSIDTCLSGNYTRTSASWPPSSRTKTSTYPAGRECPGRTSSPTSLLRGLPVSNSRGLKV